MGRVRTVTGEEVMSDKEFAVWWKEHHRLGGSFCDALRRHVAGQMQIRNFRRLMLSWEDEALRAESPWMDADMVAVVRAYTADGQDELLHAVHIGQTAEVASLLDTPHDPNFESGEGSSFTLLYLAAYHGHEGVVRCLVEAGSDMDKVTKEGCTAIHVATLYNYKEIVRCLVEAGIDKDKANHGGETALILAALHGRMDIARCLVEAGADKDKANPVASTPLHLAAMQGHNDIVRYLVKAGADKNKTNELGYTPMQMAANGGHKHIAQYLSKSGTRMCALQ